MNFKVRIIACFVITCLLVTAFLPPEAYWAASEEVVQEAAPTEAPATEVPPTEVPVTEAPQTQAPATEIPETEVPVTEAPQTQAPATEIPQTEAPATLSPEETPDANAIDYGKTCDASPAFTFGYAITDGQATVYASSSTQSNETWKLAKDSTVIASDRKSAGKTGDMMLIAFLTDGDQYSGWVEADAIRPLSDDDFANLCTKSSIKPIAWNKDTSWTLLPSSAEQVNTTDVVSFSASSRAPIPVTLNSTAVTVSRMQTYSLTASQNTSPKPTYQFTSSNTAVAVVYSTGLITGKAIGTATITVTSSTGDKEYCQVTVLGEPSTLYITYSSVSIPAGYSLKMNSTLRASNGSNSCGTVLFSSTNTNVVRVASDGTMTAVSTGVAKVQAAAYNYVTQSYIRANCTVTVALPGHAMALNVYTRSLGVGESIPIKATLRRSDGKACAQAVTYSSSNPAVATVTSTGTVKAISHGTATITVKSPNGLSRTVAITVVSAPWLVTLNRTAAELVTPGKTTFQLQATLPAGTASGITWRSSNTSVVTVSATGLITAKKVGVANIVARTYNGYSATCKVTVREPAYRALIVGQSNYKYASTLKGCARDASAMNTLLGTVKPAYKRTVKRDLTASQILSAIQATFVGATDSDVSLFYYSGHGSDLSGALCGVNCYSDSYYLYDAISAQALRNALDAVPGRVIVILDSCFSGSYIRSASVSSKDALSKEEVANLNSKAAAFNTGFINIFSDAETIDYWSETPEGEIGQARYSELRTNKYVVITAARWDQESFEFNDSVLPGYGAHAGVFTNYLARGAGWNMQKGTSCAKLADTTGDNIVSLNEAYIYTLSQVNSTIAQLRKLYPGYYFPNQSVSVYPYKSSFPLFNFN